MKLWKRIVQWFRGGPVPVEDREPAGVLVFRDLGDGTHEVSTASMDHEAVQRHYIEMGLAFGTAVSYLYMGECRGFATLLDFWEEAELDYFWAGFRALPIDSFVDFSYGKPLHGIGVYREKGEAPVSHAAYYREHFLGKIGIHPQIKEMFEGKVTGPQTFAAFRPSTKHLLKSKG